MILRLVRVFSYLLTQFLFHELFILSVQILTRAVCNFCAAVHTNLACILTRDRDVYRLDLYEWKHKSDKLHVCEYLDTKNEQFMKKKLSLEVRKYPH